MNHSSKAGRGYNSFRVGDLAQWLCTSGLKSHLLCTIGNPKLAKVKVDLHVHTEYQQHRSNCLAVRVGTDRRMLPSALIPASRSIINSCHGKW